MNGKIIDYKIFEKSADYINLAGFSTWPKFFSDNVIMPKNTGTYRTYDSLRSAALCHAVFKCRLDANMDLIKKMNDLAMSDKAVYAVTSLVQRHFLKELKIFALRMNIRDAININPAARNLEEAMNTGKNVINSMPKMLDSLFSRQVRLCWLTGLTGMVQSKDSPNTIRIYSSINADMSKSFGHDLPGVEFGGISFNLPVSVYDYPAENDYDVIKKAINRTAVETFPKASWK